MTILKHQPVLPDLPVRTVQEMGLKELERIRLILRGGSVIEWRRLHFKLWDEVDRFLRLCQIDATRPHDVEWVRTVLGDAVEYLRKTFDYRVAAPVADPDEIHDLFLYASGAKEPKKYRKIACIVLKVMHVIQHIEGRDLLFKLAVSEAALRYRAPAIYDDVVGVQTRLTHLGSRAMTFAYQITHPSRGVLADATTSLVAMGSTGRVVAMPTTLRTLLQTNVAEGFARAR